MSKKASMARNAAEAPPFDYFIDKEVNNPMVGGFLYAYQCPIIIIN